MHAHVARMMGFANFSALLAMLSNLSVGDLVLQICVLFCRGTEDLQGFQGKDGNVCLCIAL